jgi:hypothetical protein
MKNISREKDYNEAFEKFLTEYKMDRIADIHNSLEKVAEYKTLHFSKTEKEKALLAAITNDNASNLLMDYITAVDFMLDEFETIFYEHGFLDCISINKEMQKGLSNYHIKNNIN